MDTYIQAQLAQTHNRPDWGEFHQALASSNPHQFKGSDALMQLLEHTCNEPDWVDWALADEGIQFIHSTGRAATDVLRDMALMGGYLMVAFNQTLILTGELEKGAAPRLAETAKWWLKVVEKNGNHTGRAGWRATLRVRWVHALVRHRLGNHTAWNTQAWGLPINQVDMAATYLGFSAVMLLGLRKMGIVVTPHNSRAVMHLWKIIAWQMGVHPRWLVDTEQAALVRLRQFLFTHAPPDDSTHRLATALSLEPLQRRFAHFGKVQQQWAYHKHLSASWYLLGPSLFNKLGLRAPCGPAIALLLLPVRASGHLLARLAPGLSGLHARNGRLAQEVAVAELAQLNANKNSY